MARCGEATIALLASLFDDGVEHAAALIRHSAREFEPGRHDLLNPLTDAGRALAGQFGAALPKRVLVRGYASPAERCVETIRLILDGHAQRGGRITRHRAVEALGVFYVLDQMKMYRAMTGANGQVPFLKRWFDEQIADDVMMPADIAAKLVGRVVAGKLGSLKERPQLDICVSHDMSLYLVRDRLLGMAVTDSGSVDFLDGVVFYERDRALWMRGLTGPPQRVDLTI